MRSKTYKSVKGKFPEETIDLPSAIAFLKQNSRAKFDETVEVHIHLGIDPAKSEQMVRSNVVLPSGATKQQKVIAFADSPKEQKAAMEAGASVAGGEDLIAKIMQDGSVEADITVATAAMMPKVAKIARILGPKGLMPNPKTGTVSNDPAGVIKELMGGKVSFKMDQLGNIHQAVAKLSRDQDKIIKNVEAFMQAVKAARPATARGEFFKSVTIKSTMSPSVHIVIK